MIVWNKVTWYSKLAAVIFFLGIFPIWTFYLGTMYQETINTIEVADSADSNSILIPPVTHTNNPKEISEVGTTTTTVIDSGITGVVTIGPTCPVQSASTDNICADKTYSPTLVAIQRISAKQTAFKVSNDGSFKVNLPPGDYSIRNTSTSTLPRMENIETTVYPHKYTELQVQFDSGIR